ncbi:7-carboxy-7-deazaguanine synthase QueE [Streptomyces sp. NPDC017936]|uniref:7-carboxy-7-deazaguanine synthase QueE n=1 Tax=Streptomyces sp. NPDC017936 TaxID=3365016 RepID=UPI00379010D2
MSGPARPSLVVSEIFGPTVSGEGPTLGQRCSFLRLGGCNLTCTWCDSAWTWDASRHDLRAELTRMGAETVVGRLLDTGVRFVIVSGGEPLLQQGYPGWGAVLRGLTGAGVRVEVETNGTVEPTGESVRLLARFIVSPKLGHSGVARERRINGPALKALAATGKAVFKVVCRDADDVAEAEEELVAAHGIPARRVWVMPEGTDSATLSRHLAAIADPAVAAGFNVTTRLHVHAWGDERGR